MGRAVDDSEADACRMIDEVPPNRIGLVDEGQRQPMRTSIENLRDERVEHGVGFSHRGEHRRVPVRRGLQSPAAPLEGEHADRPPCSLRSEDGQRAPSERVMPRADPARPDKWRRSGSIRQRVPSSRNGVDPVVPLVSDRLGQRRAR
jgi:hypothetical protein